MVPLAVRAHLTHVMYCMQIICQLRHLAAVALPAQLWADILFKAAALDSVARAAAGTQGKAANQPARTQRSAEAADIMSAVDAFTSMTDPNHPRRRVGYLGKPIDKLRFYIQRSLISRTMRQAAAAACAREDLQGLQALNASWSAQYLSPLLAELCAGQSHIHLQQRTAATPGVTAFLAVSKISSVALALDEAGQGQAELSSALQSWDGVTNLECWGGSRPSQLPPNLEVLRAPGTQQQMREYDPRPGQECMPAMLTAACSLQSLRHLFLSYSCEKSILLPQSLVWPASLQSIFLDLHWGSDRAAGELQLTDLGSLSGCSASISICLAVRNDSGLLAVLQSLASVQLHEMDIQYDAPLKLSLAEQMALAQLHCEALRLEVEADEVVQLLPCAPKHVNLSWATNSECHEFPYEAGAAVHWSEIASPGYYSMSLKQYSDLLHYEWRVQIVDCPGAVPAVQPWALFVQHCEMLRC